MTNQKLLQANELSKQIVNLEKMIENAKTQTCAWVYFDKFTVCDDKNIIKLIGELVIKENELKLERLKKEFSDL